LIPKLAKFGPKLMGSVFYVQLAHDVQGILNYRTGGGIIVTWMSRAKLSGNFHEVTEFYAVTLSAVFGELRLRPVQPALNNFSPTFIRSMVLESIDGDGDYALCETAELRVYIIDVPIREAYEVGALENRGVSGTERAMESLLQQVRICLHRSQGDSDPFLHCDTQEKVGRQ